MKQIFSLFVLTFFFMSCQDTLQNMGEPQQNDVTISVRDFKECEQKFTPGHIYGDIFGTNSSSDFNEEGWSGSFEKEFFPCPKFIDADDCCNEAVTINFGRLDYLPFETTCNKDLDAQELQALADYVMSVATEELPSCEGNTLNPVAVNITLDFSVCCDTNTPCFWLDNPCDCYEDFPNDPSWGCCEGYELRLEVKYARTTPCIPPFTDGIG